jgi:phosphate butyryltransferase
MKGALATNTLLKAVLDREHGLRNGERVNHIAVVESPRYDKLLFITDGGINLDFDVETICQIAENSAAYAARFGVTDPRIAILALIEELNEKIPETILAAAAVERLKDRFIVEGPIAPDVALSRENAKHKGLESRVAGEVDIMILPNTTAANHLVKGLTYLGNCKVGGIVVGAKVPIILLSRADTAETKYRSILLGLL